MIFLQVRRAAKEEFSLRLLGRRNGAGRSQYRHGYQACATAKLLPNANAAQASNQLFSVSHSSPRILGQLLCLSVSHAFGRSFISSSSSIA